MEAKKNTRYLLRLFIPLIVFYIAFFIFIFYSAFTEKESGLLLPFAIIFLLLAGLAILIFVISNRRMQKALKSESPQKLIALLTGDIFPHFLSRIVTRLYVKTWPAWRVSYYYNQALAYTYWGQYSQARQLLAMMDGGKRPPMLKSLPIYIQALLSYLEKNDFSEGIALAEQYERMTQVNKRIPGHDWQARETRTLLEIGQVASGSANGATFSTLEQKFKSRHLLIKLPIAWALEKGYLQRGDSQKAAEMRQFIDQSAPYCKAFTAG